MEKHFPYSFTAKYNCNKIVCFESFESIESAIEKEKYIEGKSSKFEQELIYSKIPEFSDLWEEIKDW